MNWVRRASWLLAVVIGCMGSVRGQPASFAVKKLRCEYQTEPMGMDVRKPRLSWQLSSSEENVLQTSYEVRVGESEEKLVLGKTIWTSGQQVSDESTHVEYGGPTLESGHIYYWQVRVADNHGHISAWSKAAKWETGLLEAADWKVKWTANL